MPGSTDVDGSLGRLLMAYVGVRDPREAPFPVEFSKLHHRVAPDTRGTSLRLTPVVLCAFVLLQALELIRAWRFGCRQRQGRETSGLLLQAAVDTSDAERRRIAAEVHDRVIQDLVGLAYEFDAARLRSRAVSHDEDAQLLSRAATDVRQAVTDLCSLQDLTAPSRLARSGPRPADAAGGRVLSPGVTRTVINGYLDGGGRSIDAACLRAMSQRERDVLLLIGQGLSNADIGRRLHLSTATVKEYVSAALVRLRVANRVQAAIMAHKLGVSAPIDAGNG
jgi:DNA-binding CsgD family transcriptional regulator